MAPKFFVGGNWKMNGTLASGKELLSTLTSAKLDPNVEVVVAPPALHLLGAQQALQGSNIAVAGQNAYHKASGAFTGEISVRDERADGRNATVNPADISRLFTHRSRNSKTPRSPG